MGVRGLDGNWDVSPVPSPCYMWQNIINLNLQLEHIQLSGLYIIDVTSCFFVGRTWVVIVCSASFPESNHTEAREKFT